MSKKKILVIIFLSVFLNSGCNTIAGTAKGVAKDVISIVPGIQITMHIISKLLVLIFISTSLSSCNTVVGSVKGAAKDTKAFYIYSRDALTQRDISDTSD